MASVFKRNADRNRKNARWMIAWKDGKKRSTRLAYTDKAESLRLAMKLEDEARRRADGLIDLVAERMRDHARETLDVHVEDFEMSLTSKGNTVGRTSRVVSFINAAAIACEWHSIADVDSSRLSRYIETLKASGRGHRAINARVQ